MYVQQLIPEGKVLVTQLSGLDKRIVK